MIIWYIMLGIEIIEKFLYIIFFKGKGGWVGGC